MLNLTKATYLNLTKATLIATVMAATVAVAQPIPKGYHSISPPERNKRMVRYTCENVVVKNSQLILMIGFYKQYRNANLLVDPIAARTLIQLSPACKSLGRAGYLARWSYAQYAKNGKTFVIKSFPDSVEAYKRNARNILAGILSCGLPYDWIKGRNDNLVGCKSTTIGGHIKAHNIK